MAATIVFMSSCSVITISRCQLVKSSWYGQRRRQCKWSCGHGWGSCHCLHVGLVQWHPFTLANALEFQWPWQVISIIITKPWVQQSVEKVQEECIKEPHSCVLGRLNEPVSYYTTCFMLTGREDRGQRKSRRKKHCALAINTSIRKLHSQMRAGGLDQSHFWGVKQEEKNWQQGQPWGWQPDRLWQSGGTQTTRRAHTQV